MASSKKGKSIINSVIEKYAKGKKRETSQLSIKIDSELDLALTILCSSMKVSKNRLIEDILVESGILEEAKKINSQKS